MAHLNWSREQIEVGQVFEREGLLYKVVALIDEPVAVLVPLDERDGEEEEYHVIGSPEFSTFALVERCLPGGTREDWKPSAY